MQMEFNNAWGNHLKHKESEQEGQEEQEKR